MLVMRSWIPPTEMKDKAGKSSSEKATGQWTTLYFFKFKSHVLDYIVRSGVIINQFPLVGTKFTERYQNCRPADENTCFRDNHTVNMGELMKAWIVASCGCFPYVCTDFTFCLGDYIPIIPL